MTFGVTTQGFNRMLEADVLAEIIVDAAPIFGVNPSTTDWPNTDSPTSQFFSVFARQAGILWEQIEASFQGLDPAQAFGTLMDALLAYNNIARIEASSTQVLAAISGTQGTVIPSGTRLSVVSSAALFQALANATITNATLLRFNVQVSSASDIGTQFTITLNGNAILSGALGGSPTRDTIAFKILTAINAATSVNAAVEAVFYGSATIQIATLTNLAVYSVTLNGEVMTYTSDASATNQEVTDGVVAAINAGQSNLIAAGINATSFSLTHRTPGTDWVMGLTANLAVAALVPVGALAVKSRDLVTTFSGSVESRMAIDKLFSPQTYAAIATGPIEAPAGTLTVIETHLSGFTAATNFLDGVLGRDVESDDEARIRREETLATGSAHTAAVISALIKVPGVTLARAYENINDTPDVDGRPGHSVEFMVQGGADLTIAQVIWAGRASGIIPFGNINADGTVDPDGDGTGITIDDSNGDAQIVHFSRPESVYAFVNAVLTLYSEEDYPEEGDQAVIDAIVAFGNALGIGKDFIRQRLLTPIYTVPGIEDAALTIAISDDPDDPSPTYGTANIAISPRQVLVFDTSRVSVS